MSADRLPFGIFTTDRHLVVRTWDDWIARATAIESSHAVNRPLLELLPEIEMRGLHEVLENVLSQATVAVLAPALHPFLFTCAPTEPSAGFDRMQQHITIGPLRDEGTIVGLIVTVEDVTARMDDERRAVADPLTRHDPPREAGGDDDRANHEIESLTRLFREQDWRVRRRAVAALAHHGAAVVDSLVRTLRQHHGNLNVLSSALDLLATSDIDVVEPLVRLLDDDDENLRTQAALILGERRDSRAIPALIAHLADPDVNVAFHVIEALGRLRAVEACHQLVAIAEQRDFFLAFPALQALSRLGTPTVAPRLVPLLSDELLRAPAIEALGELGDEDVTVPLVRLLDASEPPTDVITEALAGLHDRYESRYGAGDHIATLVRRSMSAAGIQQILDTVQRVGPDRLPGLARVLGWLEGDAVQRALTRLLGHDTVRSQVVEALVRHGSGVVALLIEQLQAEDLETRQAAAVALGRIGDRRATAPLVDALGDREVAVAAAGALARIGDGEAFEALFCLLGDPEPAVRQAVIAALNSIGHPDMPRRITGLLEHGDSMQCESALAIAGYFGYPDCVDGVLSSCLDAREAVRRIAVEQLPQFDDPRIFDVLDRALGDESAAVRAGAALALGRVGDPRRGPALLQALEDRDDWVRYVALRSLAAVAEPGAVPAVVAHLGSDPAPHVRLAAIEAVGRLTPPEVLQILEPLRRASNDDIARAAIGALAHVDQPAALALLEQEVRAPEPWRRLAAIDAIAVRSEVRLSQILQWVAAADRDPDVVKSAVSALARVGVKEDGHGSAAALALVALASEPSLRGTVIAALSSLPPRRIPEIASGLRHSSPAVRCAVVEAMSRMKHPDASTAVATALDDAVAQVRLTAVAELKHLGTRAWHRKMMSLARTDPDAEVRHGAMLAIARAESSSALSLAKPH